MLIDFKVLGQLTPVHMDADCHSGLEHRTKRPDYLNVKSPLAFAPN